MHEQAIAKEIIGEATKHGKVIGITVEVGDLGHLPLEEMQEVLMTMTQWEVSMIRKEATVACECGYVGVPKILEKGHDHNVFECPECKAKMPKILDGHDIILKSVDIE